jgi:putative heme-binding domain-containing protein
MLWQPHRWLPAAVLLGCALQWPLSASAQQSDPAWQSDPAQQSLPGEALPAGNEEVARIMREFEGRGDLGDDTPPRTPEESLAAFEVPDDLQIELVASEPQIAQPIHISFGPRGRMWVVEYRQYPFPAGLKVVRYDQHLRAVFDRVPAAPPHHTRGADRINVLEDRNGDGRYETGRTVIEGLNIATAAAVGRDAIWVMNPPYLLAYPDADGDAVVDGDPVVHLAGFGLEDTHSVANSIRFGPDGWLYGVNGSTTTARIEVPLGDQPAVAWEGQCVWRYYPERHHFEIYAEGGGNPFGLEIDAGGHVFSGTNWGNTRGMHYPQGGYGVKNWGKHGPLTNPYAFGYFNHMPFQGDGRRFTEEFVIYDDTRLPPRFRGQLLAINPLQRIVIAARLLSDGSSYRSEDFESLITTEDRWFRPVDIALGPDGALYLADWYDTRLTHVDPRDNWHKTSGRIYRLAQRQSPDAAPAPADSWSDLLPTPMRFDLTTLDGDGLLRLLDHPSRWFRFAAVQVISERGDDSLRSQLETLALDQQEPRQLEALWCVTRMLGTEWLLQGDHLRQCLASGDADVRRWSARLLGDHPLQLSADHRATLQSALRVESDPQVRAQFAATARRLPAEAGLSLAMAMLAADRPADRDDPHIPLLLWWAVEAHLDQAAGRVAEHFGADDRLWGSRLVRETILSRLARRCVMAATPRSLMLAERLLRRAPSDATRAAVLDGVDAGLAAAGEVRLPDSLRGALAEQTQNSPHAGLVLRLRQGEAQAIDKAIERLGQTSYGVQPRVELLQLLGTLRPARALDAILGRFSDSSVPVRAAALQAASGYADAKVADRIVSAYQSSMDSSTGLRPQAVRVLVSRPHWAVRLIDEIDALRIAPEMVTPDMVVQMRGHDSPELQADIDRLWGNVRPTATEKQAEIERLRELVARGGGDLRDGRKVFGEHCGKCHKLFGEGGAVGPDLTGYERTNFDFLALAIVDPSAAIREEYQTYQIRTVDGQLLSGLLIDRNERAVTLRTAEGETLQINRGRIEDLQASDVSLMPENLLEPLSDAEVQSLMRYVSRKRPSLLSGAAE